MKDLYTKEEVLELLQPILDRLVKAETALADAATLTPEKAKKVLEEISKYKQPKLFD